MFKFITILVCCLSFFSCPIAIFANASGPAGIYVIGDTREVPDEVEKFNFDFVAGYTLRIPWTDIERWNQTTQAPEYDFSRIESSLEQLRERGKKMTLEIFVNKAPSYLFDPPGIATWVNPHPTQGGMQPLPWDSRTLAAYQSMTESLANHLVSGTSWRVADHPSLESVDSPIVGLQGLRELSDTLVNDPDYTRQKFIQSVVDSVSISRQAFAGKHGFLALFLMEDNEAGLSLDQAIYDRLKQEFNNPDKPTLGYFQETLSDSGPRTNTLGSLLFAASKDTYILFQALRPWTLRVGEPVPPETSSGTPITGIRHAWRSYGSTYVEIYGADILNSANSDQLRVWNRFLLGVKDFRDGKGTPSLVFPGKPNQRLQWNADSLLSYRIWKSPDLLTWEVFETGESNDGNIALPTSADTEKQFYRVEILEPTYD